MPEKEKTNPVKTSQEIQEMIAEFQETINKEVQRLIKFNLIKILKEKQNIQAFQWQQYSPYESDFEPFSRPGDFWIGETKYKLDTESNWSDVWDELRVRDEDALRVIAKCENYLQDQKNLLYMGIGNHKRVTIENEKLTIEDHYEHQ